MLMVSLSPSVWSRSILPELCALDKGVYLKIELLVLDFKLVMEMASDACCSSVKTQMPHLDRGPGGALGISFLRIFDYSGCYVKVLQARPVPLIKKGQHLGQRVGWLCYLP
jgi:hypothetical protein